MRSTRRLPTLSALVPNSSTATPGLLSGVCAAGTALSMPASHLHPITEVAKPVIARAAAIPHFSFSAVISTRVPHIANASANVSSTATPLSSMLLARSARFGSGRDRGGLLPGGHLLVLAEVGVVDRVVFETDRIVILEEGPNDLGDGRIVLRRDVQHAALVVGADLVVLDDQLPVLDHVARRRPHTLPFAPAPLGGDLAMRPTASRPATWSRT